ncbi:MAG TPA: O-antigen ligase family protein, partial [Kiritimatiellia bacterium]
MSTSPSSTRYSWMDRCLLAFALAAPVTIALAEPLAYIALPLWLWFVWTKRATAGSIKESPYFWPIVLFVCVVAFASALGLRPLLSFRKMDRLFLLGLVFIVPAVFASDGPDRWRFLQNLALLFVAGATLKALYDVVRIPIALWNATETVDENGMPILYKLGNMREPQMYMAAMCLVVGALVHGAWPERRWLSWISLVILLAAFVLHFKRGAWFAFVLTAFLLAVLAGNRRVFLALAVCGVLLLALPQARERLKTIRNEFSVTMGGRMALWTRTAPRLIAADPTGLGWRAVKHEDLRKGSRRVQRGLNHLHNNVMQVTLELGWLGLAAWLNWIG